MSESDDLRVRFPDLDRECALIWDECEDTCNKARAEYAQKCIDARSLAQKLVGEKLAEFKAKLSESDVLE